jgi:hypothetical protein
MPQFKSSVTVQQDPVLREKCNRSAFCRGSENSPFCRPRRSSAVGATSRLVPFTESLRNAVKAHQDGHHGKTQWYCGGPRSSYMYRPPHHRYKTEKTISKLLLQPEDDGGIAAKPVPTDVSNSLEIRYMIQFNSWLPVSRIQQ